MRRDRPRQLFSCLPVMSHAPGAWVRSGNSEDPGVPTGRQSLNPNLNIPYSSLLSHIEQLTRLLRRKRMGSNQSRIFRLGNSQVGVTRPEYDWTKNLISVYSIAQPNIPMHTVASSSYEGLLSLCGELVFLIAD